MIYGSIDQVRQANERSGYHFFDQSTLRFFSSRVLSNIYGGRYFVTSERGPGMARAYTLRRVNDNGSIATVGEFQSYATARQAKAAALRQAVTA